MTPISAFRRGKLIYPKQWTRKECETIAQKLLCGGSLFDCAVALVQQGSHVTVPEVTMLTVRFGGINDFIRSVYPEVTYEEIDRVHAAFRALPLGCAPSKIAKKERAQLALARLSRHATRVYDKEAEKLYQCIVQAVRGCDRQSISPLFQIVRSARCTQADTLLGGDGELVQEITVRFERPRRGLRKLAQVQWLVMSRLIAESLSVSSTSDFLEALREDGRGRFRIEWYVFNPNEIPETMELFQGSLQVLHKRVPA